MKLLKTTISKSKYFLLALLVAFSFSCNPEDGNDGAAGAVGADGTAGTDGNANVQTFVFDTSSESGSIITLSASAITQSVLDNDVILSYFAASNGFNYQTPGGGPGGNYVTRAYSEVGNFYINFHTWAGSTYNISSGDILEVKLIIIESTSTTAGKTSSKQQVYNELNQAGVNINDYYAVCDFYGIAY